MKTQAVLLIKVPLLPLQATGCLKPNIQLCKTCKVLNFDLKIPFFALISLSLSPLHTHYQLNYMGWYV